MLEHMEHMGVFGKGAPTNPLRDIPARSKYFKDGEPYHGYESQGTQCEKITEMSSSKVSNLMMMMTTTTL